MWDTPAQLPLPCREILWPSEVRPRVALPTFEGPEDLGAGDLAAGLQNEVRLTLKGQRSWREDPGGLGWPLSFSSPPLWALANPCGPQFPQSDMG